MNPDLDKLIQLQRAESELRRVEAELAELPRLRKELEERLGEDRSRLETARADLAECQKVRRQHETELQGLEAKRSKYKGQLMEVKTNKEYTAMLHEIEGVEREIRSLEDKILAEMERGEGLTAEVRREEGLFKDAEARHRKETAALDERAQRLQQDASAHAAARDAVAETLSSERLELFRRVARLRGIAVAEARDGMCQVCHLKLRPQMFVDVKHNEEIMQCPGCNRILYFVPVAPGPSPDP